MGTSNFSDDFKRDAVAQITERGYPVSEVSSVWVSSHIPSMLGRRSSPSRLYQMGAVKLRRSVG